MTHAHLTDEERSHLKSLGWSDDSLDFINSIARGEHLNADFLKHASTTAAPETPAQDAPDEKYQEVMWAENAPDVYSGAKCDQIGPSRWKCSSLGDRGESDFETTIRLAARIFPPGTKVVISEPVCPQCGEHREPTTLPTGKITFDAKCECGFDWDEWTKEKYS